MTDSNSRATPASSAVQSLAMRPLYSRTRWEGLLLASTLHVNAKLVGLVLSHLAGDAGHIPPGRIQGSRALAVLAGLKPHFVRVSKGALTAAGFTELPRVEDWTSNVCRPITLTLPPVPPVPFHTGEQP
ncbi:hypothetical protein ACFWBR_42430 [Streptomyces sp. NPDC060006]|uniref:hypothetical protein n=1 Tax=unclassified Streptomyces TaxID=2593676 RepID=UPI0036D14E12